MGLQSGSVNPLNRIENGIKKALFTLNDLRRGAETLRSPVLALMLTGALSSESRNIEEF